MLVEEIKEFSGEDLLHSKIACTNIVDEKFNHELKSSEREHRQKEELITIIAWLAL